MAEIAGPRQVFAHILSLIARLRAPPAPAWGAKGSNIAGSEGGNMPCFPKQRFSAISGVERPASIAWAQFTVARPGQKPDPSLKVRREIWRMSGMIVP
jgi:hypothetical protein